MYVKRLTVLCALAFAPLIVACGDDDDDGSGGGGGGNINDQLIYECDDSNPEHLTDDDGDGFTECEGDCLDSDTAFYPGAPDVDGDAIDHNCDQPNQ